MKSPSVSPASTAGSSNTTSEASEIDELDYRSRKLSNILRKNVSRAEKRRSVLDTVRNRAWVLEDQVKLLERETRNFRNSLQRQPCGRRILLLLLLLISAVLIYFGFHNASSKVN